MNQSDGHAPRIKPKGGPPSRTLPPGMPWGWCFPQTEAGTYEKRYARPRTRGGGAKDGKSKNQAQENR